MEAGRQRGDHHVRGRIIPNSKKGFSTSRTLPPAAEAGRRVVSQRTLSLRAALRRGATDGDGARDGRMVRLKRAAGTMPAIHHRRMRAS
jgi:hypothetical protein